MLTVTIPGEGTLELKHIVLDYNGTMACNGNLIPGVEERLNLLAEQLQVHIITADTFGICKASCRGINGCISILSSEPGAPEKEKYVETLGAENVISIGNGSNDALMLSRSALGITIIGPEGTSAKALQAADIIARDINTALDMLLNPKKLVATLRL
ncbi:MAG: ATPase P [Desulfotomaculaceae bacterium]|nr:ATPase P [Desulfotomaculaceae bacterium]MDD4767894.1 ATPase P [Desulfotomaculaceae bacterium]